MVLGDAIVFRTQLIAYHLTTEDYNSLFLYSTDENVCRQLEGSDMFSAVGIGECDVTASFGDQTATCHVTVIDKPIPVPVNPDGPEPSPVGPGAPADVPSVSGASPAMEFYLELAPGGSKAIDVPSEYLSLLSMAQWSSSDPSVCTVTADSAAGKVTAVAHRAGECDLTASLGFYSAVCHVTVGRSQ